MPKLSAMWPRRRTVVCSAAVVWSASAAGVAAGGADSEAVSFPNFNPDGETAWAADRPASDDFLPHDKSAGPGPVGPIRLIPIRPTARASRLTGSRTSPIRSCSLGSSPR